MASWGREGRFSSELWPLRGCACTRPVSMHTLVTEWAQWVKLKKKKCMKLEGESRVGNRGQKGGGFDQNACIGCMYEVLSKF